MTKRKTAMALEKIEPKQTIHIGVSPEDLISQAIQKGVDIATMKELLTMRTQLKTEWAKEQFISAMAKFQGECPVIKKTKAGGETNAGKVAYYYAPLDSIILQVKDLIKINGFSYDFQSETLENKVKVTCKVNHLAGYSEEHTVEMPLGTKTNIMSAPQVVASALTFAKRYSFCDAFGISTGDDDNDGAIKNGEHETPAQKAEQHIEQKPKTTISKIQHKYIELEKTYEVIKNAINDDDRTKYLSFIKGFKLEDAFKNEEANIKIIQKIIDRLKDSYNQFFRPEIVSDNDPEPTFDVIEDKADLTKGAL